MSVKPILAPLAALALLAAAPSPAPADATVTVTCIRTPFYVFLSGSDRPVRAHTAQALQGQRFGFVSGPRTTLESFQYYETNVPVAEPGYGPSTYYWLNRDCAIKS
jgi:hypothetical protein